MYKNKKISVSIPSYNEADFILDTLKDMPEFVDYMVVVNDASKDNTTEIVKEYIKKDKRVHLIDSKQNQGIGGSVIAGHLKGEELGADILVVMAGDNQMDGNYLPALLDKIIDEGYGYVKGNRFFHVSALKTMPKIRLLGNTVVSFMTKFATGYWSMSDPLNGYTALDVSCFKQLAKDAIGKRYDFEISMLIELSLNNVRLKDVFIPAKYGQEKSDIKILRETLKVTRVLCRGFLRRLFYKYTLFNFHPISLFYVSGTLLFIAGSLMSLFVFIYSIGPRQASSATAIISVLPVILGIQFILQAIVLDIQDENK